MKKFRDNGAIGALLDEYEKSLRELIAVIDGITQKELKTIIDSETNDESCRSIQSILSHVISAGYNYINYFIQHNGEDVQFRSPSPLGTVEEYKVELLMIFTYCENFFDNHPNLQLEECNPRKKIKVSWGQHYDIEQLMEHAIVHVLRHRRQIERFMLRL